MTTTKIQTRRLHSRWLCLASGLLLLGLAACGDSNPGTPDAGDATTDATDAGGGDAEVLTDGEVADASVITPDGGPDCDPAACAPECAVYVDRSLEYAGDGTSPQAAFKTPQAGVDSAAGLAGECCTCEVRVAEGRYTIFQQSSSDTLRLRERVLVYGGYPEGFTGARNPAQYVTILDGQEADEGPGHVYHVVTGASEARLDGFTVTGGRARADANPFNPDNYGGGMFNLGTAPIVANCTFQSNQAVYGGGVYNSNSFAELLQCRFEGNLADQSGGGVHILGGNVTLRRCTFRANHASEGGGLHLGPGSNAQVSNTTFSANTAAGSGGAVLCDLASPLLTNTSFSRNSAASGGAIHSRNGAHPVVTNSVLWDDTPDEITHDGSSIADATYCDVMGGCTVAGGCTTDATGNLDVDPLFVDAEGGDLRLWVVSPVVDQGNNAAANALPTDQEGDTRILDGDNDSQAVVDLGADEVSVALPLPTTYVDHAATGANDGTSWLNAYVDLQSALTATPPYHQIWVATGTYVPSSLGDRTVSFVLPPAVEVFGGFDPAQGIATMGQRDPIAYETILSGDLMGDDGLGVTTNNSFNVVKSGSTSFLDGFTVTAGWTDFMYAGPSGACLYIQEDHQISVRNCHFTGCRANTGAAIYAEDGSKPMIEDSTFTNNTVISGGGGAVALADVATGVYLRDCTFDSNTASYGGGALLMSGNNGVEVEGCTFTGNSVSAWSLSGGALYLSRADNARIASCNFTGNSAGVGGAMGVELSNGVLIEDTIFDGNQVADQSIVQPCETIWNFKEAVGGGLYVIDSEVLISGSTFTGNTATYTGTAPCMGLSNRDVFHWFFGVGGGVFALGSTVDLVDTTFTGNQARIVGGGGGCYAGGGGGLATYQTSVRAVNVAFWGNIASTSGPSYVACSSGVGGGFWSLYAPGDQLANAAFKGNSSTAVGGGLYFAYGSSWLYGATVTANGSNGPGAGGYIKTGTMRLYNSIVWGNSGVGSYPDVGIDQNSCNSSRKVYSYFTDIGNGGGGCLPGCSGGNGACVSQASVNPLFVDSGSNPPDLHLQPTSPALGLGSDSASYQATDWLDLDDDGDTTELIPFDMDGNARRENTMDLGAYERP